MSNVVKAVGEAIPPRVRLWMYALYGLGSPLVVYLSNKEWIGGDEVTLWVSLGTVIGATGAANVNPKKEKSAVAPQRKAQRARRPRGKARNRGG